MQPVTIAINYFNEHMVSVFNSAESTLIVGFSDSYFSKINGNKISFFKSPPACIATSKPLKPHKVSKIKIKKSGECVRVLL
jgi:hypothetical protein